MDYIKLIIKIISLIVIAVGIAMIFDARKISGKWFSYSDKNSSTKLFKIIGFVISLLGGIVIILNM